MPDDIRQHIQTAAVRHAQRNVFDAEVAGALDQLIKQWNDRFAAFDRKTFLPQELRVQKALELLGRYQFPENLFLDFDGDWFRMNQLAPDLLAQPKLFFLALNVAILDADFAAVRALQNIQNLAQRRGLSPAQPAGNEQSIEIPNRKVVRFDVQLRVIEQRHRVQRIDVRDQAAADSISIYQFHHARLPRRLLVHLIGARKERRAIDVPAQRRMGNAEIGEDVVIKALFADQQLVHPRQKCSRLRALNDAMIVMAADCDRLTNAELRKDRGNHRLIFRRIFNRAGGDDHRLPGHQARR